MIFITIAIIITINNIIKIIVIVILFILKCYKYLYDYLYCDYSHYYDDSLIDTKNSIVFILLLPLL